MSRELDAILERWEPVIGLEVHVQLATESKIFCGCSTEFGGAVNSHTCEVCLGMPGALPVFNRRAGEMAAALGFALGCKLRRESVFARKNYFYADLPKGYQITQFEAPICEGGSLKYFQDDGAVGQARLLRIHLEEDAGKSVHDGGDGVSRVDLNRAGVPLLEVVSLPDLFSPEAAAAYLKALRGVVRALGISDGNMQEGSLRCDANISLRARGEVVLGTRCEIKNLNSFRFVSKAIQYEIRRQAELLDEGGGVRQETRLYDPDRDETRLMRVKEDADDYRYFPDPDLPPLWLSDTMLASARRRLVELPVERQLRYQEEQGLAFEDARLLCADLQIADFYDEVCRRSAGNHKLVANWIVGDLQRELKERALGFEELPFSTEAFSALLSQIEGGVVSGSAAKQVLAAMLDGKGSPGDLIKSMGLQQVSDESSLEPFIEAVMKKFPVQVSDYRAGKTGVLGFLMGQLMRETKGKANPKLANNLLKKKLGTPETE